MRKSKINYSPKVSIIIPVYNSEKYLTECLDSVINQTLQEIEIICVDDCSTDNSLKILQEYANTDERITIIKNIINEKQGAARNKALKIARGEYVQFVDSDDYLELDACEILYNRCHMYNIDIMNFAGANFDTKTREVTQLSGQRVSYIDCDKIYKGYEIDGFRYNVPVSACRFFYRRGFLVDHDISFPVGLFFEDNIFIRRAMLFAQCFGGTNKILYNRRVHSASTTQNTDKYFADYIKIVYAVADMYNKEHVPVSKLKSVMQMYCNALFSHYILFNFAQRNKYYVEFYKLLKTMVKKYDLNYDEFSCRKRLEKWYSKNFGYINLDNPKTFNEKIQWSKIYDSTPIKTRLADKYLVRDWVAEKIGEQYLIPLLEVYDSFEEIDFDKLPKKFVIKCNHGSGYNIIVKDKSKLDLADVKAKLDKWMSENFAFKFGYELHYRDIPPKIIIEKFIENKTSGGDLYDYKFWCFNGKVEYIQFLSERNIDGLKMAFYDKNWNKQDFVYSHPLDKKNIEKPSNLDKMIKLAEVLSADFNHVRVDFYRMDDGKLYFGEMTFTSASGMCRWNDERINRYFGKLFKLPKLAYNIDTGEYYKYKFHSQLWCLLHYYRPLTHFWRHIKDVHFIKNITNVHPIKHFWQHIKDIHFVRHIRDVMRSHLKSR